MTNVTDGTETSFAEEIAEGQGVTLDDFYAYMPTHVYLFTPCREVWTAASINARLGRVPVAVKNGKQVTISASI
jgi:hypothetical protein